MLSIIIVLLAVIAFANGKDEKMIKQSKAYTCMLLVRAKMESLGTSAQEDREAFTNQYRPG